MTTATTSRAGKTVLTASERIALEDVSTRYGMTEQPRKTLDGLQARGLLRLSGIWYLTPAGRAALEGAS